MTDDARKQRQRIEANGVTLLWGDTTEWKAELRAESLRKHLARPIEERLLAALELVLPSSGTRDRDR